MATGRGDGWPGVGSEEEGGLERSNHARNEVEKGLSFLSYEGAGPS